MIRLYSRLHPMEGERFSLRKRKHYDDQNCEQGERKSKQRKTAADYSKEYRKRLKENHELYRLYRAYETSRVKEYRDKMTAEKKAQYKEKSRIRQQKYRQQKKESGAQIQNQAKKRITRAEKEALRKQWREDKGKQRSLLTPEARRRINEKRRILPN